MREVLGCGRCSDQLGVSVQLKREIQSRVLRVRDPHPCPGVDRCPGSEIAAPARRSSPRCATGTAGRTCSAAALAMMADNIEHVITYWVLWQKFHSPALAGFEVISHWVPFLLFSVYFGSLADRYDCRRLIQARPGAVHAGLGGLGRAVPDRTRCRSGRPACCSSCTAARERCGARRAADAARLRRPRGTAQRGPAERDVPQPGHPVRPGGRDRCCCSAWARPAGIFANIAFYLPLTLFLFRTRFTGHTPRPRGTARRGSGCSTRCGCCGTCGPTTRWSA